MRAFSRKKSTAVTLFEMLLILFVSSMVALSTFKYQQQQRASDVANPLAEKMYLYAQTVRTFVSDNQEAIANGTLNPFVPPVALPAGSTFKQTGSAGATTYTFTGVTWLQTLKAPGSTVPYLPKSFTFAGLNPLELRRDDLKSDAAIQVQITSTKVTILFGAVYDLGGEQKLQGSVTAAAATKANKMYDPLLGISSFTYTGGIDKDGNAVPISAVWDKSQNIQTQLNTDTTIDGNLDVDGDVNLKAPGTEAGTDVPGESGDNSADVTGVGTLAFDQDIATKIANLDKIDFSLHGHRTSTGGSGSDLGGEIDNLGSMDMVGDGSIDGVGDINFAPGSDAEITFPPEGGILNNVKTINFVNGGVINNLDTLNFSNGSGKITGVQSIEFPAGSNYPASKFQGFGNPIVWQRCATPTNCNSSDSLSVTTPFNAKQYICSLNYVRIHDGNNDNNRGCLLSVDGSQTYVMIFIEALTCGMLCHPYNY